MKKEEKSTTNKKEKDLNGNSILKAYRAMVEEQSINPLKPAAAYGEFSNISPHSQFSNHSKSFNQKA